MTLDKVHPAHGAAIVEVEKDESGGNCDSNGRFSTVTVAQRLGDLLGDRFSPEHMANS